MLLATTAIILPDVSFTVPCNTSSGITKHRLPLVQFGAGRLIPSLETMGLTNGSLRPCAPNALTEGLGFSAACAAGASGVFLAVPGAGALAGTVTPVSAVLVWFPAGILGWRDWLHGNYCGRFCRRRFLGVCLLRVSFFGRLLWRHLSLPPPAWAHPLPEFQRAMPVLPARCSSLPWAWWGRRFRSLASRSALGAAALLFDVLAGVPAAVFASDFFWLLAAFFAAGFVLPVLLAAAGVAVGEGWGWPLAPEFCAVATVAMAVASARICISFISIPFCALFILNLFTASPLATELVDPASAARGPVALPVHD